MRLQIKTLNQKTLLVEMSGDQTVLDLKNELAFYPDVGVGPEEQKLIYAGHVMANDKTLDSFNIDTRKYLLVMKGQPTSELNLENSGGDTSQKSIPDDSYALSEAGPSGDSQGNVSGSDVEEGASSVIVAEPARTDEGDKSEERVAQIVSMGYDEAEVRQALAASYNDVERAIEYLVEGLPSVSDSTNLINETSTGGTPLSHYMNDPDFRSLRHAIRENPDDADGTLEILRYENPELLRVITENEEEFMQILMNDDDLTSDEEENPPGH